MTDGNKISEEKRRVRFERWERLGLDLVKHDLLTGGHRLVGGSPQVRELAREWVRMKEAEAVKGTTSNTNPALPAEKRADIVTLKPTIWGISLDLKEAWRRLRTCYQQWRGRPS